MEWEIKKEMCKLGNQLDGTKETRQKFNDFVLQHINEFDGDAQAVNMFINCITLSIDEMKEDTAFINEVYNKVIKNLDYNSYRLREQMRLALFESICQKELNLI